MSAERRGETRYWSSQKAVLLGEGGAGSLCVITNLSSGGLCLAVVGSTKPWKRDQIDLKVNQGVFLCTIVNREKNGLHCRFSTPIGDPTLWKKISPPILDTPDESLETNKKFTAPSIGNYSTNYKTLRMDSALPGYNKICYSQCLIYAEGILAGREQIDPTIDALDATVDVLNPYREPDERDRWALGFKDAIFHVAKYYGLY